ncbi:MAG: aminotransferase class I/II-fold pyridoxal phosphate-dependent enzyme [Candidatus Micrarchaeota archaeon]
MIFEPSKRSELVSYPIRDIVVEAKKLEKQGTKMFYLNIGDPAPYGFRPPQHILDAVKDAIDQNYSGYAPSEGDPELREVIAKYEKVAPEDVFVCSGLSEGIDFLYQAMVDPGSSIILPAPTYPLYLTKQRLAYGPEQFYKCDDEWQPDLDSMRKNITKNTKAISIINPNNPTGAIYPRKTLQEIVDMAGEFGLPIISDDAYELIVMDGEYTNMRELCKDVPLVSGNSMSKNYVYPGSRVGYVAFHGQGWEKIKDAMQRLCNQRLSVNWEQQRGMIAAMNGPKNHIHGFNMELKKRRDLLVKRINDIEGLRMPVPKGAFYAFVEIEKKKFKDDWTFVRELLKEGVVVVPGAGFTSILPGQYFRLVFLADTGTLNAALDRIERFMK